MAPLHENRVDILSRKSGTLISQTKTGVTHTVMLNEPSVVRINGTPAMVEHYERQGNDLILHMRDGTTVRYQNFFFEDDDEHSELVFDNGAGSTEQVVFPPDTEFAGSATVALTPDYAAISGVESLMLSSTAGISTAALVGAGLGLLGAAGVAIGVSGGHSGNDDGNHSDTPPSPTTNASPGLMINALTGDNRLEATEKLSDQLLSGTTSNVEAGQIVTITLNGTTYSATVEADGSWQLYLPASALANLPVGLAAIDVTVSNLAGETANNVILVDVQPSADDPLQQPGTLTITTPLSNDGYLNASEAEHELTITGYTTGIAEGSVVTIAFNGNVFSGSVNADGSWSITLPPTAFTAAQDGQHNLVASVTDTQGNNLTDSAELTLIINHLPHVTVDNSVLTDGILDLNDTNQDVFLHGNTGVSGPGQTVTIHLGDNSFTAVVDNDGEWSFTIPAETLQTLPQGEIQLDVTATDVAGNSNTSAVNFIVDTLAASLTVNAFTEDDFLSNDEKNSDQLLSGTTSAEAGEVVTIMLNGQQYQATVGEDGTWSTIIPSSALEALAAGNVTVSVSVSDADGQIITTTHNFTVEPVPVSLTITEPLSGDGYLNAAEAALGMEISGTATGVSEGTVVTLTLNDNTYSGTINADGSWSIFLPAADLASLQDGLQSFTVTIIDSSGNEINSTSSLIVAINNLPELTLNDSAFTDGIINLSDAGSEQVLSGTTGISTPGQTVEVQLDGHVFQAIVNADGSWELTIPAGILQTLPQGENELIVTVTDPAGNSSVHEVDFSVDTLPPVLKLDSFAGNNIIDGAERLTDQVLSGTASNVEAGRNVIITLNDQSFTAQIQLDGSWHVIIPVDVLQSLPDGAFNFTVTVSDAAGNTTSSDLPFTMNSAISGLSVDTISLDNYLNASEAGQPLLITGTSFNVPVGGTVTLLIDNQLYSALVMENGRWGITIPSTALTGLPDGPLPITVTAIDAADNAIYSSATLNVLTHTLPTLEITSAFGDGILNAADMDISQFLSGTTGITGTGQTVTVQLNGNEYTGSVDLNGNWHVDIPPEALIPLSDGDYSYQVTVSDVAGNTSIVTDTVTVDKIPPILALSSIGGDDILCTDECAGPLILTGYSDAEEGQEVILSINGQVLKHDGQAWTTTVGADGSWTLELPAGTLSDMPPGLYTVTATVSDMAGNSISENHEVLVATGALQPTLNMPFADGYLSANEASVSQSLSGFTGVTGSGQTVTVSLNGTLYNAAVNDDGSWSLSLDPGVLQALPEGTLTIVVKASDSAGNAGSTATNVSVDFTAPDISINTIAADNVINAQEITQGIDITGTASPEDVGQLVTVTLNEQTYQTLVLNDGSWCVTVPAANLQLLQDGDHPVQVSLSDAAGNTTSATVLLTVDADPSGLPTLTLSTISEDGYLNQAEANTDLILSGTSTGLAEGTSVTVILNGQNYYTVVDAQGHWRVTVPSADVSILADGEQQVIVKATDGAGNPANTNGSFTVIASEASQPTLTVDLVAGDNVVNSQEANSPLHLSGSSQQLPEGTPVTITLNGVEYTAVIDINGNWMVTLPAEVVTTLPQGAVEMRVTATDIAGNPATTVTHFLVNTTPPSLDNVTLSAGDTLNLAEALTGLTVSGTSEPGLPVTVTLNDVTYNTRTDENGNWSLVIPSGDLQQLSDGRQELNVSVTDAAGNTSTSTATFDVAINNLPSLTIDTPFSDSWLNLTEASEGQTLTGTATHLPEGTILTVTFAGHSWNTVVDADGNWSLYLSPDMLTALSDGTSQISVATSDMAGNPAQISVNVNVLTSLPLAPTISTTAGDNVINTAEAATTQVITGTTDLSNDATLSVSVDGIVLAVTVDANGNWTAVLSPSEIATLGNGSHTLTATITDIAGNSVSTTQALSVETAPLVAPTIDIPFGDGYVSFAEAQAGGTLSGIINSDNTVSVTVNLSGQVFNAEIHEDGTWSLNLPSDVLLTLPDGICTAQVIVTDNVGNTATASNSLYIAVHSLPDVTLNLPFGDGALNQAESQEEQLLAGSTGVRGAEQRVEVIISGLNNDQPFIASVDFNGYWALTLPPEVLAALENGEHTITVTAFDAAGNSDTLTQDVISGVTLATPTLDNAPFGNDFTLNISEAASALVLTGTTGATGLNQIVSLTVDDGVTRFTGTVDADGNWQITLPPGAFSYLTDGSHTLNLTVVDPAGNTVTQPFGFIADLTPPAPTIDPQFVHQFLNATDLTEGFTLTGTTGETGAGQSVIVRFENQTYTASVDENGNWSLPLLPADLVNLTDDIYPFSVTATDSAGNTAVTTSVLVVDTTPPVLMLNPFATDNVLDYSESVVPQILSGTALGAEPGALVNVLINGTTFTTTVGANGSWSLGIMPEQMAAFTSPATTMTVNVTDMAGNVATSSLTVAVDLTPPPGPQVTLGTVSGDNVISTIDVATVTLSGTATELGSDGAVTLLINGVTYATTLDADGNWTTTLPVGVFGNDGTTEITVNATGSNGSVSTTATVMEDRTLPVLTIDPFTGDNYVTASECGIAQTLSGTASLTEVGRTVYVMLNGRGYTAIVQADGTWTTTVPADAMHALSNGLQTISVQLTDAAGNTGTATQNLIVTTQAPQIELTPVSGDNSLNAGEIAAGTTLSGRVLNPQPNETITLYDGNNAAIATVDVASDGSFSFVLTQDILGGLTDGTASFSVGCIAGTGEQAFASIIVNKVVNPDLNLTVDPVFGDGTLSAADTLAAQVITGTAISAGAGAVVSVVIGETTLTADVGLDGRWAVTVPTEILSALSDGNVTVHVVVTDAAGNSRSVNESVYSIVHNVPTIDDLTGFFGGDNILNREEAATAQTLSGVLNAAEGSRVTVALGSHTYTTFVTADGSWSVTLPAADLTALPDGPLALSITVVDPVGNIAANSTIINKLTSEPTITLISLFGDGVLNLADITTAQEVSGVVTNASAGSVVTLTVGDSRFTTVVGEDGRFSVTVDPSVLTELAQGEQTINIGVTDTVGNNSSVAAQVYVDTTAPIISLDSLFNNGQLNAADAQQAQSISGTVSGVDAGTRVIITVAGQQFYTTTDANGNFSTALTPTFMQGLADGELNVAVAVTDSAGNSATASTVAQVGIHALPQILLSPLFGDGILNFAESLESQTLSGTVINLAEGSPVQLQIGNVQITTTVNADGAFSVTVTPDLLGALTDNNTVTVTVTDSVGNIVSTSANVELAITDLPTLTLDTIFVDGVLSAADLNMNQIISGTSTHLPAGTAVTVMLNGVAYATQVTPQGTWSINVPKADLSAIADGTQSITVTASDNFGNPASATGSLTVISHTTPDITINTLFDDNTLSVTDAQQTQFISGTATNAEGATVVITIGTQSYTTTVNSDGSWSMVLPPSVLTEIADGTYTVTASVTNAAGSSGDTSAALTVLSHAQPTVTLDNVFGNDGYLNIAEASVTETITGTCLNAPGGIVTLNVAGSLYTTTADSDGTWQISVPSEVLQAIDDGTYTLTATVTDLAGNTATISSNFTVLSHTPPQAGIDPVIGISDATQYGLAISGDSVNAAQGTVVTVTLLYPDGTSGPAVITTVDALGHYNAHFSPQQLLSGALPLSGDTGVRVDIIDAGGNTTSTEAVLSQGAPLPVTIAAGMQGQDIQSFTTVITADTDLESQHTTLVDNTIARYGLSATHTTETEQMDKTFVSLNGGENDLLTAPAHSTMSTDVNSFTIGGMSIALSDLTKTTSVSDNGENAEAVWSSTDGEPITLNLAMLGLTAEHIGLTGQAQTSAVGSTATAGHVTFSDIDTSVNHLMEIQDGDIHAILTHAGGSLWDNAGMRNTEQTHLDASIVPASNGSATLADILEQHINQHPV